ncbi:MAG: LptF/LptG family permease [Phycisphaerae bacterium]
MAFPWTLQKYIFREMGKSFALTAVSLTGVLGLGGGVLQMVDLGEVTPGQMLKLLLLMMPIATALTLPMAALFSAASIYGRLSADNEFVACRSSGINLFVLFVPAVVLSLVSAVITFALSNFVIPGMVRNIENFLADDIVGLVKQRLNRPQGITLGGRYRIYAEDLAVEDTGDDEIVLRGVAFVEVNDGEWARYGTANEVRLVFERSENPGPGSGLSLRGSMIGLSVFDRKEKQFYEEQLLEVSKDELPQQISLELKFLTLTELLYFYQRPEEWREVQDQMDRLRLAVGQELIYDHYWADWDADGEIIATDQYSTVTLNAKQAALLPRGGGIEFYDVTVTEQRGTDVVSGEAARGAIATTKGTDAANTGVEIEVYDVRLTVDQQATERVKESFGPVAADPVVISKILDMTGDELLSYGAASENPRIRDRHEEAAGAKGMTSRRIMATLNERSAFGISVVVLVLLGAALGIVFRGAHVMIAFGISFIPSMLILVCIIMGKQMMANEPTYMLGFGVLWGGIVIVGLLDGWTLAKVVRR